MSHLLHTVFDANFVSYISAEYDLNWFSFHTQTVVMKVIGVNFFGNAVYILRVFTLTVEGRLKTDAAVDDV